MSGIYILLLFFLCFDFSGPLGDQRAAPVFTKFSRWPLMNDLTFSQSLKGRCYCNQFSGQIGEICVSHRRSSHWHPKTDQTISTTTWEDYYV